MQFEESLAALENIVGQLEKGELPLEASLQQFEQGIHLAQQCQKILTEAEQKVEILTAHKELPADE